MDKKINEIRSLPKSVAVKTIHGTSLGLASRALRRLAPYPSDRTGARMLLASLTESTTSSQRDRVINARDSERLVSVTVSDRVLAEATLSVGSGRPTLLTCISAIDLGRPDAERPGAPFLFIKDVKGALIRAHSSNHNLPATARGLETTWMNLSRLCGLQITSANHDAPLGLALTSVMFVAASGAVHYRNERITDALTAFVTATYRDRDVVAKMRYFDELLTNLVATRVFPHTLLFPAGGLVKATESERIANYILLQRGGHEDAGRADLNEIESPCFRVPACVFVDLDNDGPFLPIAGMERGAGRGGYFYVYMVFVYAQEAGRPGYELYIVKSILREGAVEEALTRKFLRRSITNIIDGHTTTPRPRPLRAENPPFGLARAAAAAVADPTRRSRPPFERVRADDDRLAPMAVDTTGRPTRDTAMFAAYALLGVGGGETGEPTFYTERRDGTDLRFVKLPGMTYKDGAWHTCA